MKAPEFVMCKYCVNQGLAEKAQKLRGPDAVPKVEDTTRYDCGNGHKFALPNPKQWQH